jgi:ankyrin repeat protein
MKKNVEAVNALLAAGADPNDVSDESPLLMACRHDCLGAVSALIAAGADVNFISSYPDHPFSDCTPLDMALCLKNDAIVAVLKEAGALTWQDLMVKTNELLYRDNNDSDKIILHTELVDNSSDKDRENALKLYVLLGGLTEVRSLLAAGVDPSLRFCARNLLSIASCMGNADIVRALLDAGADITYKDEDGKIALQWAAMHKHRDIVALLLAKANELKNANK